MSHLNALVTGAYGFIGRHVTRALAAGGYRVVGIGHGAWNRDEWRAWGVEEWHLSDVTLEALAMYGGEPDIIVHCAGSGSVSYSISHPLQDYRRTVDTAMVVLEFMRTVVPSARLVVPSSTAVYGSADKLPITVNAELDPVSPYGVHKKIVEDLCRSYSAHFGLRTALVRLFSVYGIGLRKQLLWDACTKIRSGNYSFMGTGAETRDLLHVEDAARLLLTTVESASDACPVVNGGSGEAIEIRVILDTLAKTLGVTEQMSYSGVVRSGDPLHYRADISTSLRLGWKPILGWRKEVVAYAEWFKRGAL